MAEIKELLDERKRIIRQIDGIVAMRRGSVTKQFAPKVKNGRPTKEKRGPYPVFSFKRGGRTVSRRISNKNDLRRINRQVDNYHSFQDLCRELVEIGEQICVEHERQKK